LFYIFHFELLGVEARAAILSFVFFGNCFYGTKKNSDLRTGAAQRDIFGGSIAGAVY
jgi:hypothetical protein